IAHLPVSRVAGLAGAVTIDYSTTAGSATPGAGNDYTTTTGTLNFADGQDTAFIDVPINDDSTFEPAENFTITLTNPGGGAALGSPATQTVTIYDNDGTAPTGLLLNEIDDNPPTGTDGPFEYVELIGTPGQSLNDVEFVSVE